MTQGKVYGRNSEILSGKVRSLELYEIPFINILTVLVCSGEEWYLKEDCSDNWQGEVNIKTLYTS